MEKRIGSVLLFLSLSGSVLTFQICHNFRIVSRTSWSARDPEKIIKIAKPVQHLFIGHTATPFCWTSKMCAEQMRNMQNYHMSLGWGDIGYNFVIGGDGKIYEGVGWNREGVHTYGWNSKSLGIAFIGDFMEMQPGEKMLKAGRKLIVCGIKKGRIRKDRLLHGARDGTCTNSPGTYLYEIIRHWPGFEKGPLEGYKCLKTDHCFNRNDCN